MNFFNIDLGEIYTKAKNKWESFSVYFHPSQEQISPVSNDIEGTDGIDSADLGIAASSDSFQAGTDIMIDEMSGAAASSSSSSSSSQILSYGPTTNETSRASKEKSWRNDPAFNDESLQFKVSARASIWLSHLGLDKKLGEYIRWREIKQAFNNKIKSVHPDRGGDAEQFQECKKNYFHLSKWWKRCADPDAFENLGIDEWEEEYEDSAQFWSEMTAFWSEISEFCQTQIEELDQLTASTKAMNRKLEAILDELDEINAKPNNPQNDERKKYLKEQWILIMAGQDSDDLIKTENVESLASSSGMFSQSIPKAANENNPGIAEASSSHDEIREENANILKHQMKNGF